MEYDDLVAATQPEELRAALADHADELQRAAQHHHAPEHATSVRTVTHNGHEIVVRTTYEITVDGKSFDVPLTVDNSGRVHYHGLPTRDFGSTVDLVKKVVDSFPEDFGDECGHDDDHDHHDHDHHDHDHHDHGGH